MKKGLIASVFLLWSCGAMKPGITPEQGKVISIQGQLICVEYEVLNFKNTNMINCYLHKDMHFYSVGDSYPKNYEKPLSDSLRHIYGLPVFR